MLPVAWSICVDAGGEHAGAISGAMNTAGQVGSLDLVCRVWLLGGVVWRATIAR